MLKYVPYDVIKKDEQAYAIMLLRDQNNNTFSDIAKEFKLTASTVTQTYNRLKLKQTMLYINQISVVLEQENNSQIRNIFEQAYECYHDRTYACAYLEIKYKDILSAYRNGEPGMPPQFIKNVPPFKLKLSKKTIERIVEMREVEKISFIKIAKKLHITSAKAKHTYDTYYLQKVLKLLKKSNETKYSEQSSNILGSTFIKNLSSKRLYEMMVKNYTIVKSANQICSL